MLQTETKTKSVRQGVGTNYEGLPCSEEKLANRLHALISLLPNAVIVLDENGIIQECNPVALDLLGKPLLRQRWSGVIERAFSPQSDDGHEVSLRDGRRVSISTRSLYPEAGQLITITDVSSARTLQDKLNQKQRLSEMGGMAAHLAHQIRTPLATAMLYTRHLQNPRLEKHKQPEFLQNIMSSLNNLEQQVRDMLLFARGERMVFSDLDVTELLNTIHSSLALQLAEKQASLTVNNQVGELKIAGNFDALLGAIQNFILNALQACDENIVPTIILSATREGDDLIISVTDNGCGISVELENEVRKPFFTTRAKGTGLGLAVAEAVAKCHQGILFFESPESEGTTVGIKLPINQSKQE